MVDVKDVLVDAMRITLDAELPDDFQTPAFVKVIEILWEERRAAEVGDMASHSTLPMPTVQAAAGNEPLTMIAARLRIDPESVEQVFHVEDGRVDIVVPGSRFDPAKSRATKQLAILITAARQGAELEEWTDADEIRHFATEFRRYDSANFATTLKELDDVFLIRQSGRRIVLKLSRPGWEAAAALVRQLVGEV